jgi:hypothetical protein
MLREAKTRGVGSVVGLARLLGLAASSSSGGADPLLLLSGIEDMLVLDMWLLMQSGAKGTLRRGPYSFFFSFARLVRLDRMESLARLEA